MKSFMRSGLLGELGACLSKLSLKVKNFPPSPWEEVFLVGRFSDLFFALSDLLEFYFLVYTGQEGVIVPGILEVNTGALHGLFDS